MLGFCDGSSVFFGEKTRQRMNMKGITNQSNPLMVKNAIVIKAMKIELFEIVTQNCSSMFNPFSANV
jgi:hypothetical protein